MMEACANYRNIGFNRTLWCSLKGGHAGPCLTADGKTVFPNKDRTGEW